MYFLVTIVIYNILILHGVLIYKTIALKIFALYSVADIHVHVSRALR